MQQISANIIKQKITESKIYIAENCPDKLKINMNCRTELKTPKKIDEKSVLLNMQLNIEAKEELKIELNANVIFKLEQLLDDYDEIAEKKLIPTACKALLNSLDDILVAMGYNKMELAKEI